MYFARYFACLGRIKYNLITMQLGLIEEPPPPSPLSSCPPACSSEGTFLGKAPPERQERVAWTGVVNGTTFGSLYFFAELFIHGNKINPFNFKRKLQGFPVPRAETQYPHRPDKHQLSEDNALAFHASGYRGKKKKKVCFRENQCFFHYHKRE